MNESANKQALAVPKATEEKHPLMEFVPTTINSSEEWLARWNGTPYLDERLGLLHSLTAKSGWRAESNLVSLLLSVADGYAYDSTFASRSSAFLGYNKATVKNRKAIAEKAFSTLCLRFFKDDAESYEEPSWWWMLKDEALFQKVLWFLRPSIWSTSLHNGGRICEDSNDHQVGIFRTFVRKFAHLGWKFPHSKPHWDEQTTKAVKQRLVAARPRLIDILLGLRELGWLNKQEIDLDAQSIKKLTEIALSSNLPLPTTQASRTDDSYRKPKSLEEAVLGGSVAAEILLLHRVRQKERERIARQYKASERTYQKQQRALALDAIEKERKKLDDEARQLTKAGTP